jgi:hypothetical protein
MKDFYRFRLISALILACALVLAPGTSGASAEADLPSHPAPTKDDLTTLFDGLIPEQLERDDLGRAAA